MQKNQLKSKSVKESIRLKHKVLQGLNNLCIHISVDWLNTPLKLLRNYKPKNDTGQLKRIWQYQYNQWLTTPLKLLRNSKPKNDMGQLKRIWQFQ